MDSDKPEPGTPGWIDLQCADPDAAATFYAALFGWTLDDAHEEADGHRTLLLHGRLAAGIGPLREPALPGWTMFVADADVDQAADRVTAAGGRILTTPTGDAKAERRAVFADPDGVRFAVRQTGEHDGAAASGEPGAFSWSELITDDVDASAAFYGSVFGWTVTGPEGPLGRREWQCGGRSIAGLLPRPPAMPKDIAPYWDVYFTVADAATSAQAAVAAGGTQLMAPTDIGSGRIAVFLDPAGAIFTVIAPKS